MEQVHKPHNISAVIRTAYAVGVHEDHAVWSTSRMRTLVSSASGSNSWVQVKTYLTIAYAVSHLKTQGMQILATNLLAKAIDFREVDYTRPTCILFCQEKTGITQEALTLANQDIIIPMICMVQSLNVSVASALILYEAQHQHQCQNAGMFQREAGMLDDDEQQRLLFEGGYPVLARVATRKKLPRSRIDNQGQIIADTAWGVAMQSAAEYRERQ